MYTALNHWTAWSISRLPHSVIVKPLYSSTTPLITESRIATPSTSSSGKGITETRISGRMPP